MKAIRNQVGGLGNILFKQAYLIGKMLDGEIPDIYVQSPKYWEKHKDTIRAAFSEGLTKIDKVALHVRRGDYLNQSFHTNLTETDYYKKAIALFPDDTQFLVFCKDNQDYRQDRDDQMWCYEYLKPLLGARMEMQSVYFKEHEDFNAMASCKAIIAANSSFSWWASFLGDPKKRVIMPKEDKWFTDGQVRTELLPEWEQLDFS